MTIDIEKEFQEQYERIHAKAKTHLCGSSVKVGYIAAVAPRDLLIEQLVGALKTCESGEDWQLHDEKIVDAALSAAKERGYE